MKFFLILVFLALGTAMLGESPVKATLAYSRETIPGTPTGNSGQVQNPFPTSYLIYVVVQKGTPVSATGACVQQKCYKTTLSKVGSPVTIDQDPNVPTGKKDVLVQKTEDDVYKVELQGPHDTGSQDCKKLASDNAVTIFLESGGTKWRAVAKKIVPLRPAAAM